MNRCRAALFGALLLPLTGCVFAVGSDDEGTEALRDRVRALEGRVDRIEHPGQDRGRNMKTYRVNEGGAYMPAGPSEVEPEKDPR